MVVCGWRVLLKKKQKLQFTLNTAQSLAFESIINWACTPFMASNAVILSGFAGTGKTTLIKQITLSLKNEGVSVALCAPTNKAVKVLKNLSTNNDCMTIYSLLGLEMSESEDTLKLVKKERDRVSSYQLIVLDECSMVTTQLFEYIQKAIDKYRVKFLFVGDPQQLNPVGEEVSPIWGRFETYELSEVVRHDNQILSLATTVRSSNTKELDIKSDNKDNKGVWKLTKQEFVEAIKSNAKEFEYSAKAIAWRNIAVDNLNNIIRHEIFGAEAKKTKWLVRDKIVFTQPYVSFDENLAPFFRNIITDEEAAVVSVKVAKHHFYPELNCYYLTLDFDDELQRNIMLIHEDSEADLKKILEQMASGAKMSRRWDDFWTMKKSVASVKYAYAITAHRAQGSTYESAYVDMSDILLNRNGEEAKRCLYVAVTRPTTKLILS
jgi:exodeoxyribonuclease-5